MGRTGLRPAFPAATVCLGARLETTTSQMEFGVRSPDIVEKLSHCPNWTNVLDTSVFLPTSRDEDPLRQNASNIDVHLGRLGSFDKGL